MGNKLEVGMHCYDKTNRKLGIGKIFTIEEKNNYGVSFNNTFRLISMGNLVASFNIIDLIQEGDYIRIITSARFNFVYESYGKLVIGDDIEISKYTNKFIAEVITKEQIEQMAYKVIQK